MRTLVAIVLGTLALTAPAPAAEDVPDARRIMGLVDERDEGDNVVQDMRMILIDRRGHRRTRALRSFTRRLPSGTQSVMFFLAPADVRETGFLTYDYHEPGKADDQWLYLPSLDKIKRVAAANKSNEFMGSDFFYSDMTKREFGRYDYRFLGEDVVPLIESDRERQAEVWLVEAVPKDRDVVEETGYERSVYFVHKEHHVTLRAKSWVAKRPEVKFLEVKRLDRVDGVWFPTEMRMTTRKGRAVLHRTVLVSDKVRIEAGLDPDVFTVRRLAKGL